MGSVTAHKVAISATYRDVDFAALSPTERARVYRQFAGDARIHREQTIEPYQSLCFEIATVERLAADLEAGIIAPEAPLP